jgi:two-component system response regulator AtoC
VAHALVVEDDEDSARVIAALLERDGHSVISASSLAAARRLIAMQRPDLLLLDLHLPDGNGFDLLNDRPEIVSDILILMTGQASLETSIKALRLGAADYLVKPINPQHLKGLLSRLIRPRSCARRSTRCRSCGARRAASATSSAARRPCSAYTARSRAWPARR